MKKNTILGSSIVVLLFLVNAAYAQEAPFRKDKELLKIIEKSLGQSAKQYSYLQSITPEDRFPKTYEGGEKGFVTSTARYWTSGFYPGTLIYLYEGTNDKALLHEAERKLVFLEGQKDNKRSE